MDIPNSGAIFTLGKSHLAENTQSYFYIKNDPVKRLIAGPHQSAVICESGRLFVWGENHYGQLGIGGHSNNHQSNSNNSNNNNHNHNNSNTNDITTKPTCVKSLKTLGLKICDAAYGNDWAVILTLSNEIFYTGRSIFPSETHVAQNFTTVLTDGDEYAIIRKPFRLEEFDDYLSKSEDTDNFIAMLAGNEHFALLTSTGRLIGCGSNAAQQLGELETDYDGHPVEIKLDAPIQQFTCGPESTLVLTATGSLFLTGRLQEFVFPRFTELQKNLAPTEQIIYMHISKMSEIFIVTNVGSIYRSYESMRSKSLVFQRFYDYDSEENGPIWKLLKGFSFYAVLSKANKFFTTFSESGHHLKTFREISKFKNLRLLDIAVGEQHILVHGIPRSSTLSATVGPDGEHRFLSRSFVLQPPEMNGNVQGARSGSSRSITKQKAIEAVEVLEKSANVGEALKANSPEHSAEKREDQVVAAGHKQTEQKNVPADGEINKMNGDETEAMSDLQKTEGDTKEAIALTLRTEEPQHEVEVTTQIASTPKSSAPFDGRKSPTESTHSRKSLHSVKFDADTLEKDTSGSSEQHLRPRTPYPESSTSSSPQSVKKIPIRNFSYEAAMRHEHIERISPELADSLETVQENFNDEHSHMALSTDGLLSTPSTEEDEQLTVEITTIQDPLDQTMVVNEIRFINNGVDVTENVKESMPDTPFNGSLEELGNEAVHGVHAMTEDAGKAADMVDREERVLKASKDSLGNKLEAKLEDVGDSMTTATDAFGNKLKTEIKEARDSVKETTKTFGNNLGTKLEDARDSVETATGDFGNKLESKFDEVNTSVGHATNTFGNKLEAKLEEVGDSVETAAGTVGNKLESGLKEARDSVKTTTKTFGNNLGAKFEEARDNVESANDKLAAKFENAGESVQKATVTFGDQLEDKVQGMHDSVETATDSFGNKLEAKLLGARDSVQTAMRRAATGARGTVDTIGDNAKRMADDAVKNVEEAADETKKAMKKVGTRISHEMSDAKDSIASLFQTKATKDSLAPSSTATMRDDDDLSSKESANKLNTNTNGMGEDDERTTASVNSTHTSSAGNPFETAGGHSSGNNPFESTPYIDDLDAVVERGKKAMQEDLRAMAERTQQPPQTTVNHEVTENKGRVRQFFDDVRSKGMCRSEKSIRIDDEPPPPHYNKNKVDSEISLHNGHNGRSDQNSSRVCTIL